MTDDQYIQRDANKATNYITNSINENKISMKKATLELPRTKTGLAINSCTSPRKDAA